MIKWREALLKLSDQSLNAVTKRKLATRRKCHEGQISSQHSAGRCITERCDGQATWRSDCKCLHVIIVWSACFQQEATQAGKYSSMHRQKCKEMAILTNEARRMNWESVFTYSGQIDWLWCLCIAAQEPPTVWLRNASAAPPSSALLWSTPAHACKRLCLSDFCSSKDFDGCEMSLKLLAQMPCYAQILLFSR